MSIENAKLLVAIECKRVIEILESGKDLNPYGNSLSAELKYKMHELRRDTIRLENLIYRRD